MGEPMNYGAFDQFLAQVKKCFVVDSPVMRVFTQRVAAVLTAPTVDSQVLGTTPWTLRFAEEALLDLRGSMHAFADASTSDVSSTCVRLGENDDALPSVFSITNATSRSTGWTVCHTALPREVLAIFTNATKHSLNWCRETVADAIRSVGNDSAYSGNMGDMDIAAGGRDRGESGAHP